MSNDKIAKVITKNSKFLFKFLCSQVKNVYQLTISQIVDTLSYNIER